MRDIEVVPFEMHKHYAVVAMWWEAHGQAPIPVELLPRLGFFVASTCAGFLYQTDSGVAIMEGLISSPESHPQKRDEALDAVTEALCAEAQKLGFHVVYGFTSNARVSTRGQRLGFNLQPDTFSLLTRRV